MSRFIAINPDRCISCGTCQSACSKAHRIIGRQGQPRLSVIMTAEVSAAVTCHHCEGAPCALVCPKNAISHDNGAILIDEQACVGCKMCSIVCPFGAIHMSGTSIAGVAGMCVETPLFPSSRSDIIQWQPGVYSRAVKCDLCSGTDGGPQCVLACPTNALEYVTENSLDREIESKQLDSANSMGAIAENLTKVRRAVK